MDKPAVVSAGIAVSAYLLEQGLQVGGWTNPALGTALLTVSGGAAWFSFVHWLAIGRRWRWLTLGWVACVSIGGLFAAYQVWMNVPMPTYLLWLDDYNFADGLLVNQVTWRPTYRLYHFDIVNPWTSRDLQDMSIELEMPAVVRRKTLISPSTLADGVNLMNRDRMLLKGATVVEVDPSTGKTRELTPKAPPDTPPGTITGVWTQNSNQIGLRIKSLHRGGSVSLELLADFATDCACSPSMQGIVVSDYTYQGFFGQDRTKRDRFLLQAKGDPPETKIPSHALKLTPSPMECPSCGGTICSVPGKASLIDEPAESTKGSDPSQK